MKRYFSLLLVLLLCLTGCTMESADSTAVQTPTGGVPNQQPLRSVLAVTYTEKEAAGQAPLLTSHGSAVIVEIGEHGDAYLATNYHTVAPSVETALREIRVFPYGQETGEGLVAQCLWFSRDFDLALLYLPKLTDAFPAAQAVSPIQGREPLPGEAVFLLGNRAGAGLTLRSGEFGRAAEEVELPLSYQADAVTMYLHRYAVPVAQGDSGGGLFTAEGAFIGMVNARRNDTEEGYAIPAQTVLSLMDKAIASAKKGAGIQLSALYSGLTVSEQGIRTNYETGDTSVTVTYQVKIDAIAVGSVASLFLQEGDVLLEIGGQPMTRALDLQTVCLRAKSGDLLTFRYRRGEQGRSYTISVSDLYLQPIT